MRADLRESLDALLASKPGVLIPLLREYATSGAAILLIDAQRGRPPVGGVIGSMVTNAANLADQIDRLIAK